MSENILTTGSTGWQTQEALPPLRWVKREVPVGESGVAKTVLILQQLHRITGDDGIDGGAVYSRTTWIDVPTETEESK